MRYERQQLHHGWIQSRSWNHVEAPVAGKHRPACSIRVAAIGIKDHPLTELRSAALRGGHHNHAASGVHDRRSQFSAEIPGAEIICRDCEERRSAHSLESALPIREKKQLAFLDRSADTAPIEVTDTFGLLCYPGAIFIPPEAA